MSNTSNEQPVVGRCVICKREWDTRLMSDGGACTGCAVAAAAVALRGALPDERESVRGSAWVGGTGQEPRADAEVEEWEAEEKEWWATYYKKASARAGNTYQERKARGLRKAAVRMLRISRGYKRMEKLRRGQAAEIRAALARSGAVPPTAPHELPQREQP